MLNPTILSDQMSVSIGKTSAAHADDTSAKICPYSHLMMLFTFAHTGTQQASGSYKPRQEHQCRYMGYPEGVSPPF